MVSSSENLFAQADSIQSLKSGLGVSFGAKGARIGIGPKGPYVSAAKDGLYRENLGTKGTSEEPSNAAGAVVVVSLIAGVIAGLIVAAFLVSLAWLFLRG
jgi:hypothetical protein